VLTLVICICKNLPASAYALSTDYRPWLALVGAVQSQTNTHVKNSLHVSSRDLPSPPNQRFCCVPK
jgi:hypothetical protein